MTRIALFGCATCSVVLLGCGGGSQAPMAPSRAAGGYPAGTAGSVSTTAALFSSSAVDFGRCLQGAADAACMSGARFGAHAATGAAATVPGAPLNLSGSSSGSTVTLNWSAPIAGDPVMTYIIEAGSSPGLSDLANFSTGNTLTVFSASGIGAGSYYVRVRALNASGMTSVASNEWILIVGGTFCTAPPAAPSGLSATPTGSTVSLAWIAPPSAGCPATSYLLQAGSSPGLSDLANANVGNTTSYVATGVGNGTYYVRVRAANAYGQSAGSNEFTLTVGSAPAPTPTTPGISPTAVNLGAAGGCVGAVLSTPITVTAPAGMTWTVGVAGSLTPPGSLGGATLDRSGGTGSGTVTLTVRLNPQTPIISCSNTSSLQYSNSVYFLFSNGTFVTSQVSYTYIAVF